MTATATATSNGISWLLKRYVLSINLFFRIFDSIEFSFIFFFILIWSPFAFISLYEGVVEDANYFSLECIGNSLIYVQGTVHTFLYGINKELLDNIKKYLFQFNYDLRISLRQITLYDSPVVSPMASPPVSPPSTISSYYPETRVALP